jgi:hypothetical protein
LICAKISGVTGLPERSTCCFRTSTRELGTGLPLTTAKFCAIAEKLNAATKLKANFVSFIRFLRLQLNLVGSKFYGQGMEPVVQEFLERIIHKAMTLDAVELFKMSRSNQNPEMAVKARLTGAGMACVLRTFINDL